jgi:hypothetical protein
MDSPDVEYVGHCIALHDISFELESRLREMEGADPKSIEAFLTEVNGRISVIGRSMAGLPIPRLGL